MAKNNGINQVFYKYLFLQKIYIPKQISILQQILSLKMENSKFSRLENISPGKSRIQEAYSVNKSISAKFVNYLLQIPEDSPVQFSIQRIKELMMFKKQHSCCNSNKNQLKMLRCQVQALRRDLVYKISNLVNNQVQKLQILQPNANQNHKNQRQEDKTSEIREKDNTISAYSPQLIFKNQIIEDLMEESPTLDPLQIDRIISAKWISLDSEMKSIYQAEYQRKAGCLQQENKLKT